MTDIRCNNAEYLVDKYLDDIVRMSLVYVKNIDDAQDIASQVFVKYIEKEPVFENDAHAKNWLFKVTVNLSRNFVRLQKPTVDIESLENILSTEDNDTEKTERDLRVYNAVLSLRRNYREVIHMYYYEEYSVHEISDILGISENNVRTRLARARTVLEKKLKGGGFSV